MSLLKHIWAGPWTVKVSFLFLAFVYLTMLIGDPGFTIYITLFLAATSRLISWVFDEK